MEIIQQILIMITIMFFISIIIYSIILTITLFDKSSREININDKIYVKIYGHTSNYPSSSYYRGAYRGKVVNKRYKFLDGFYYTVVYDDSHELKEKSTINEFKRDDILIDKLEVQNKGVSKWNY